ncbi:hypothetical protein NDU88_005130 [Pleurodeles waltl]|uniref:Uncharacterized protein n=1 Tax=Pleurodeles waltl TaxID=8319 RepID=A0AAV7SKX3_PLEWA|nr:hypothetical protein NDU88_005130 [Pleurodeles waltl]
MQADRALRGTRLIRRHLRGRRSCVEPWAVGSGSEQPWGPLGPGAGLLQRPATELACDRVGRACWSGLRGGAAALGGVAHAAEAGSPSRGRPHGVAFQRPLLPGEAQKHPGGRGVQSGRATGVGLPGDGGGAGLDLVGPWWYLGGARLRRQQEEGAPLRTGAPSGAHRECCWQEVVGPCRARGEPLTCTCAHPWPGWPTGTSWADGGTCEAGRSGESLEVRRLRAGLLVLP